MTDRTDFDDQVAVTKLVEAALKLAIGQKNGIAIAALANAAGLLVKAAPEEVRDSVLDTVLQTIRHQAGVEKAPAKHIIKVADVQLMMQKPAGSA